MFILLRLCNLFLIAALGAGHCNHAVTLGKAHHAHAAAIAALHVDIPGMHTDDNALQTDEDDVVLITDDTDARHMALFAIVANALAAAVLHAVIFYTCAAALALFRHGEHRGSLAHDASAHHLVAFGKADGPHTRSRAAQHAQIAFCKADSHTLFCGHDQLVSAAGDAAPGKAVAVVQVDGNKAGAPDIFISGKRRALDNTLLCQHGEVAFTLCRACRHTKHIGDVFLWLQLQKVYDIHAF